MRVQGDYGPFQPNRPLEVPLWMAMALHKRKKCRIQPPGWMDVDHLKGDFCRRFWPFCQIAGVVLEQAPATPMGARQQVCMLLWLVYGLV